MTRTGRRAAMLAALAALALVACKHDPAPPDEGSAATLPEVRKLPDVPPTGTPKNATPFQLAVAPPAGAKPGEAAIVTVAVTPAAGYEMNPAYPYTELTLAPPAGVTAKQAKLSGSDAQHNDKQQLSFAVELTCAAAGTHRVTGELKFAVCTEDETACLPQTRPVEVAVVVH